MGAWRRFARTLTQAIAVILTIALCAVVPRALGASTSGVVQDGPLFRNATYTGPPACTDALLPDLNADTPLHVCAIARRPEGGGGLHIISVFTMDGELAQIDMADAGYQDCFGADPFPSRFSGTLKLIINCKSGDGNDRQILARDSGIRALPVTEAR